MIDKKGLEYALNLVRGSDMPLAVCAKDEEQAKEMREFIKGRKGAGNIEIVVDPETLARSKDGQG